jgi:hypothetical protein
MDCHPERIGATAVAVRKGIPHKQQRSAYLLVTEILLAAVHKYPGCTWSGADISELLSLQYILAGDLNAKHPSWNSAVSNPSGENLLQFLKEMILKFQHHNAQPITPMWEMKMSWTLWCIRISDFQVSLSPIFWIQSTYQ